MAFNGANPPPEASIENVRPDNSMKPKNPTSPAHGVASPPSPKRRPKSASSQTAKPLSRDLPYTPPYDWQTVLSTFRTHQLPYLESVDDSGYERVIPTSRGLGWLRVTQHKTKHALRLSLWNGEREDLDRISNDVRRMFDLNANPQRIGAAMGAVPCLAEIWQQHPGLRIARTWSGFESLITTILGQLVSVRFGRTLIKELMEAAGETAQHPKTLQPIRLFPTVARIEHADLSAIRTSELRRNAIRAIAKLASGEELNFEQPVAPDVLRKTLLAVPGIGSWTAEYVAMRGFHDDDAFPSTDYVLKKELKLHPEIKIRLVRPWRAYAAIALWKNFFQRKGTPHESVV